MNGNQMDTTCTQITNATNLSIAGSNIAEITGIQYFDSLKFLDCYYNQISNLSVLPHTLEILYCDNNMLTSLPTLPNTLKEILCSDNFLTSLPTLPNSLEQLFCSNNQLSGLPSLPNSLEVLNCSENQISTINTLPNSLSSFICFNNQLTNLPTLPIQLNYFDCGQNQLTSLPALPTSLINLTCNANLLTNLPTIPNSLVGLNCGYNLLTNLPPLPNSLSTLECQNNQLISLPILPNSLSILWCYNNQLNSLPNLPSSLGTLLCSNNQLTSIPTLPISLNHLSCEYNQLLSLPDVSNVTYIFKANNNNISCISALPQLAQASLGNISNNPLTCVPNQTSYSLGLPLCIDNDPIYNPNNCPGVNITGYVFTDQNNNCTYNNIDMPTENIPVKLLDNQSNLIATSYTVAGAYSFASLLPDTFQIKIEDNALPIALTCGQSNNHIVILDSANQTISNINFPVVCDTAYDIEVHSVSNQGWVFPGQLHILNTNITNNETWYNVNCGSSNNSGPVVITITGPVTYISSTGGALIPNVIGNSYIYNVNDFNSLTPNSFGLQFLTDTTAQAGDQICVHVEINPTPLDGDTTNNVYDFCYQVVNSYDPNMKEVYPVNVLPGYDDWFTYTIHFQNTGNAPAFNIRLSDTLDANLDINSFEVRGYSHPAQISLNGNILTVRFNNIMLPDSATDYEGSMGYFQYRIKPLPNLTNGTQIENTAYIYFDYNAPIITNTTINNFDMTVKTNDIKIESEHYMLYPNPSAGIFMFKENKNIKTVEVFNMMGELVLSHGNAKIINLQAFPKGIYMARINGSQVCRLVKE
jgi:uncharacterized repeat protein (TIGR01451 family)